VKTGFIQIGGNQVPVEIFLGGDYKVIFSAVLFLIVTVDAIELLIKYCINSLPKLINPFA
jgi:hypothetical protein